MSRPAFLDQLVRSEPFRVFQIVLGILLLPIAGLIGVLSPAPIGIVVLGAGLALILQNSRWARRQYLRHTRRYPRVRRVVDFGMRRGRRRTARQSRLALLAQSPPHNLPHSQP
ncbi:hypothetical protein [Sandarakinorhabdus sp.]|uniref:hypothetical protein n=1 Tax=Sandarakinorhabdus sp. TaxID=1916663 RepID=UPI003342ABB0